MKLNILIICSWFPPDTAIGAIRPYMFAKYLSKEGNNVTVIRLGTFEKKPDINMEYDFSNFKVISVMGKDSPAEKIENGDACSETKISGIKRIINKMISNSNPVRNIYNSINELKKSDFVFKKQKIIIDKLNKEEKYDIIFSTFSNLENIYSGEYAKSLLGGRWLMDFRDSPIKQEKFSSFLWNIKAKNCIKRTLKKADICTVVSDGLAKEIKKYCPNTRIEIITNGYEKKEKEYSNTKKNYLNFTYTGSVYGLRKSALLDYARCISELIKENKILKDRIIFTYAGMEINEVSHCFSIYGIEDIIDYKGYVGRAEIQKIQEEGDIFVVASWNTNKSQGIITAKFVEGIREKKPILVLMAGNEPNSELYFYNEEYEYGFCYEQSRFETSYEGLKSFIMDVYNEKMNNGIIKKYSISKRLQDEFCYEKITERLIKVMSTKND